MLKAGVIGHPISHSKSPLIHGYWLAQYGIDGEYKTYDIAPENLERDIRQLQDLGLKGFNVTLPHKQNIMKLCSTLSSEANAIEAVNTITILEGGQLHGHNTDAFGFTQNLDESIPDFNWEHKVVAVIGSGGASKAILYALAQKKVGEIRITNRTRETAEKMAAKYNPEIYDWERRHLICEGADLIINTTSLGMKGQPDLEIDLSGAPDDAVVYDIVYKPLETSLLEQARNRKLKCITGIGMLLHQARPGFEAWFGIYPQVTEKLTTLLLAE